MIAKLLLQNTIFVVALGALPFASAGTLHWPAARVFRENSFAAPVVKVQAARHHRVISSGPYAFVRHPMYSGIMLFFAGVPLLPGSWWGVVIAPVFAIRARIEERALVEGLPD